MMKYRLACVLRLVATLLQVAKEEAEKQLTETEQRLANLEQEISRLQVLIFNYLLCCHCCWHPQAHHNDACYLPSLASQSQSPVQTICATSGQN